MVFGRKRNNSFEDVTLDDDDINADNIEDVLKDDKFRFEKPKSWTYYVFFKKEVLVGYLLCVIVAAMVITPITLQNSGYFPQKEEKSILGICGVKSNYRIDCAPDLEDYNVTPDICENRGCCWDSDTPNATCYHRMPSPRSARFKDWNAADPFSGSVKTFNLDGKESSAQYQVTATGDGHLLFQLGTNIGPGLGSKPDLEPNLVTKVTCPDEVDCNDDVLTFDVSYKTSTSGRSLIRSHFGPMIHNSGMSEISLYLPNNIIYAMGLENLTMGTVQEAAYFNLDGQSQVHLPVVVGMYDIQRWYLVYLATSQPVVQTLRPGSGNQPVLTWTFEGDDIKVHLFESTSPLELQLKLRKYISVSTSFVPAPQTSKLKYGYHLCRRTSNLENFYQDQLGMNASDIPYDYDCIDENLMKTAFTIDPAYLPKTILEDSILPLAIQMLTTDAKIPCVTKSKDENVCVEGKFRNKDVFFPNVFDEGYTTFVANGLTGLETGLVGKSAVYLHDFAPTDQNENQWDCDPLEFTPKGLEQKNQLCLTRNIRTKEGDKKFLNVVTDYPTEALTVLSNIGLQEIRSDIAMLEMPSHITFTGSKFSSTWQDIKRSLLEALMLGTVGLPYYSMPACGVTTNNSTDTGLLCLRWFQLASYMPGMHSWYQDNEKQRLPFNLPKSYERYVRWAIEERYRMYPYYRTLEYEWLTTGMPMIRPMFLMHPEAKYLDLWGQFYLGDRILVAPVLHENQELVTVKFPTGTWYTLGSRIPVSLDYQGATTSIHSKLYEIPAFMRGGSVLVYHESIGKNLTETEKANYLVIIPLECARSPRQTLYKCYAEGDTYLGGDAKINIRVDSVNTTGKVNLQTTGTPDPLFLNIINSMEVIGLKPVDGAKLDITLPDGSKFTAENDGEGGEHGPDELFAVYNGDKQSLLIRNMKINSDNYKSSVLSWNFVTI